MRPLIGSEEANRKWRRCIIVLSRHVVPFREDLHSAARLIDPAPPITKPLPLPPCSSFLCQAQWRPIFLRTSRPRRAGPCVFIFFFPSRGSTCVAKRRSGVERRCEPACDTVHTLSCHIGFRFNGLKRIKVWKIGGRVSGNKLCTSPGVESII